MPDLAGDPLRRFFGFTGMIDDDGATRFASALNMAVNEGMDEVHVCMSSLGGYVHSGIYLYNHIRSLPLKVVTYNVGTVASIATAVFVGATERHCSQHGVFMIHPTSFPPQTTSMTATLLDSFLHGALADDARTEAILRECANVPDGILNDRRTKDVYIAAQEGVQYGLAHSVREFALPEGYQILQI